MYNENIETENTPVTLAGALLEDFRRIRRILAEVYDVDESVSLEMALWGDVDKDCDADEEYDTDEGWTERDIKRDPQKEVRAANIEQRRFQGNAKHGWQIRSVPKENVFAMRRGLGQSSDYERKHLADVEKTLGKRIEPAMKHNGNSSHDSLETIKKGLNQGVAANKVDKRKAGRATELSAILGAEDAANVYSYFSNKGNKEYNHHQKTQTTQDRDALDRKLDAEKQSTHALLANRRRAAKEKNVQLALQHAGHTIKGQAE